MALRITLSVDTNGLKNDKANPLKYIAFSDNKGDTYDNPNDKTSFDSYLDSDDEIWWTAWDPVTKETVRITMIKIDSAPVGFFSLEPQGNTGWSWNATVGTNSSTENMICKYTIFFDDDIEGDIPVPIDPKLQIRQKT